MGLPWKRPDDMPSTDRWVNPPEPEPKPKTRFSWFNPPVSRPCSRLWYLLPILTFPFGGANIIGGIIAWYFVKDDDLALGRKCLVLGACISGLLLLSGYTSGFIEGFWYGFNSVT